MSLKSLMVDTKSAWVSYPGLDGFEVHVTNFGREKLIGLRKSCMRTQFDRKTKVSYEELDEKEFVKKFTAECIKGWKGLKYRYLEELVLVDLSNVKDLEEELPYDADSAELLVSNSADFDQWLNAVVFDLNNFRSDRAGRAVEQTGKVSE